MESHDLDQDTAERVQEIMEEYGVDEDDAIELTKYKSIVKIKMNYLFS